jgi:phosphoribosylglycinamide formyltransferase-1
MSLYNTTMPTTHPFRIVVLASTNGTDLQAIIDEMKAGKMPGIELTAVISNKKDCYALKRAREQGYKTIHVSEYVQSREEFDTHLIEAIDAFSPDLICLVGYMRILTPPLVRHYKARNTPIINVHPSLIPKFCGRSFFGKTVHEAVLAAHEKETGMTIHLVDEGVDTGKILIQERVSVTPNDTPETLKEKVVALEKKYYPEIIRQLATSKNISQHSERAARKLFE